MPRIQGPARPSLLARLAYWFTKRKVGRVILPVQVAANHPRILRGHAGMEMALLAVKSVDERLKALAQLLVATHVGCPF